MAEEHARRVERALAAKKRAGSRKKSSGKVFYIMRHCKRQMRRLQREIVQMHKKVHMLQDEGHVSVEFSSALDIDLA
jgi:hypothetical protein